jgi:hypothetical protein
MYSIVLFGSRALSFILVGPPDRPDNVVEARELIGSLTSDLLVIILALYSLLLFFESFSSESPYTKRNLLIGIFIAAIFSSLTVLNIIVQAEVGEISAQAVRLGEIEISMFREQSLIILALFALFTLASLMLIFVEGIILFRTIDKKRKKAFNDRIKQIFSSLKKSSILIVVAIFLFPAFEQLSRIVLFLMVIYMGKVLLGGGIFIFRDDTLRLLIVIDDSGIPSYTYRFRDSNNDEVGTNDEMLFSGALKAVSMLFSSLTGSEMDVKEIVLEGAHLTIMRSKIAKRDVSVVLISDKSSAFYQEAVIGFSEKFPIYMVPANEFEVISGEKKKKIDDLVESLFGILK